MSEEWGSSAERQGEERMLAEVDGELAVGVPLQGGSKTQGCSSPRLTKDNHIFSVQKVLIRTST